MPLPSVSQYNQNFQQNNPQYKYGGQTPLNTSSTVSPMGAKTAQPVAMQPKPTLQSPGNQNQPPTTSNVGLLSRLSGYGAQDSPDVEAAKAELERYQNAYANASAAVGLGGQDFGYTQGTEQNLANQYQQGLASRQAALSNALTEQGQLIGATESATGLTQPTSQFGVLTNPQTGQPIMGGTPESAAFRGGQIGASQALGASTPGMASSIGAARDVTSQLKVLLSNSGLNQNQLALSNWVGNVVAKNMSDPKLAPIQASITNAISQYANVLGVSPQDLTNSLTLQSGSQSILDLLNSLDNQAYSKYSETQKIGQGGGISAPVANAPKPTNSTGGASAYTLPNGQTVYRQPDGTYK